MSKAILDASGLLALIKKESGAEIVEKLIGKIIMSSVNLSEVATILLDSDMSIEECEECINPFVETVVSFDKKLAFSTAILRKLTKYIGLSLGDRACLATAIQLGLPVYTADKAWAKLNTPNLKIHLIR